MCEIAKKGEIIVGDRYYGLEYGFLNELRGDGISLVFRIRNKPHMVRVEEFPLTDADGAVIRAPRFAPKSRRKNQPKNDAKHLA